jgi:IS5 family transposase
MTQAEEELPGLELEYCDHNRRAKRRLYGINNAKKSEVRRNYYRDLIKVTEGTKDYATAALANIEAYDAPDPVLSAMRGSYIQDIKHFLGLTKQVITQTIRRVLNGEQVPADEKVVSIFEPHTNIIEKGGRETVFGHKVCLTSGKSGLILDCMILKGNPADTSLVSEIIERHKESYGRVPDQIVFDGGFASIDNRDKAKELGVIDVVFSKTKGMLIETLASSQRVFKVLTNFRAGIEAGISALKRAFGFSRVLAKGLNAFKTSLLNGVAAFNLSLLARHNLART